MTIPFKSLRYPGRKKGEAHRWGFQIQRDIESKNESAVWAPVSRDEDRLCAPRFDLVNM